ncbi:MAG: phosphotransferase family protein [Mycobacteriales bacterium]
MADSAGDRGSEAAVVGPYLAAALHDEKWQDCAVTLLTGGNSNLTYLIRSAAGDLVLRRPPLGQVAASAHDVIREHTVMQALGRTAIPVPRMLLAQGADDSPLGVPFYAMERVVGHVCRDALPVGYADEPASRRLIAEELVDVMGAIHACDPAAVGLDGFGRPAGFLDRQMRRWAQQWEHSRTGDRPELEALRSDLVAAVPASRHGGLVHGDFRIDNAVLHPSRPGTISAVLDWEMSTLGDPLADLGTFLMFWPEADEDERLLAIQVTAPLTAGEGFLTRAEVVERYATVTGFDLSDLSWYRAFAFFKYAVICEGIAARMSAGSMLGAGMSNMEHRIEMTVELGREALAAGR